VAQAVAHRVERGRWGRRRSRSVCGAVGWRCRVRDGGSYLCSICIDRKPRELSPGAQRECTRCRHCLTLSSSSCCVVACKIICSYSALALIMLIDVASVVLAAETRVPPRLHRQRRRPGQEASLGP